MVSLSPTSGTAGSAETATVTAEDAYGNVAAGYTGTVALTSNDPAAVLSSPATLTNGVGTFTVTPKTAESLTSVTATDTVNTTITGTTSESVAAGPAIGFMVSLSPTSGTAGSAETATVTAEDAYGNVAAGYTGTVALTSNDPAAVLSSPATLTNGVGTFTVTPKTAESLTSVTATDTVNTTITGTTSESVAAGPAIGFMVSLSPTSGTAGSAETATVTAEDAYGNVAAGYTGTVALTSNDPAAVLSSPATLTNGVGTFTVTPKTAESLTSVTATDTVNTTITGTTSESVAAGPAIGFMVSLSPTSGTAGSAETATVTAEDAYGNVAAGYTGTVALTSNDPAAVLSSPATLTNGVGTFTVTPKTAESLTSVTATDTVNTTITGTTSESVAAGPAIVSGGSPPPLVAFAPTVSVLGSAVTLTGTVSAQAGLHNLDIFEGTMDLGSATVDPTTGTWSLDYTWSPGFHTGIQAVATDTQGVETVAPSNFDLTTGVPGEPYKTVQDSYDPVSSDYLGSTFFKKGGAVYLQDSYAARPDGGSTLTYTVGSFFNNKAYSLFVDSYDANGNLTEHVESDTDGSHYTEIDANNQVAQALGSDSFVDYADGTRFVFHHGDDAATIYGFQAVGAGHDALILPNSDVGKLAQILAHAHGDGQGSTTLNLGQGDSVTLLGVPKIELQKHPGDFAFHA